MLVAAQYQDAEAVLAIIRSVSSRYPNTHKHSLRPRINKYARLCLQLLCCCICVFTVCVDCARKPPLFAINHPKKHEHTLLFFPRKESLKCDFCGLRHGCIQCDFVAHKECVYFPCIIRISRHEHRLSFNSSLTPEKWLCGICRGKIDTNYGRYSCLKRCSYGVHLNGVHLKCATRTYVWDGKELEEIPEDAYEDIKSFNEIRGGVIQHFSHQKHQMRLDEETNRLFDENRHCQACTLPICDDIIYNCTQCDFTLHQDCAHLPRKKLHVTHPHPLTLQVDNQEGWFKCTTCHRISNGFMYLCHERDCDFILDVRCASVSEPLDHWCHTHLMFLTFKLYTFETCSICHECVYNRLNCGDCGFIMCFKCATLPSKMGYKHDEHYLIFAYDKDGSCEFLCDVCEEKKYPDEHPRSEMYICNVCDVAVHIKCLLGENICI